MADGAIVVVLEHKKGLNGYRVAKLKTSEGSLPISSAETSFGKQAYLAKFGMLVVAHNSVEHIDETTKLSAIMDPVNKELF